MSISTASTATRRRCASSSASTPPAATASAPARRRPQSCAADCPRCEPIPPEGRTVEESELCFERWGPATGYRGVDGEGSGGSLLWTYAVDTDSKDYAYWHFDFDEAGRYRLEVSTPAPYDQTRSAPYVVRHAGMEEPMPFNQSAADGWQVLGEYAFEAGGDQWLKIGDGTGEPSADHVQIVMDGVRLTRLDPPLVDAGVPDDAGFASDAGVPADAAIAADGGRPAALRSGCGCTVAGSKSGAPWWLLAGGLLLLRPRRPLSCPTPGPARRGGRTTPPARGRT